MNRFFSKLDLRDIRIDPRSSRFGPDEGDDVADAPDVAEPAAVERPDASANEVALTTPAPAPYVPSWTPPEGATPLTVTDDVAALHSSGRDGQGRVGAHIESCASDDVLKVSARSRPSAVAGAIAGVVREAGRAEVQAIGAGATNQAVKAVAIARDYLQETGIEVICLPAFIDVTIGDEDRTAIRLVIEPR